MASSSQWEHDIFVNFRGSDVRKNFMPHLVDRLKQEGLSYFLDEDPEHAGKKIEDKIFPAIGRSRVAILVLSENYADSRWCLDELVEILECSRKPKNLVVIPIFYGVEPADVKNLTRESKFRKGFERLVKKKEYVEKKTTWRKALKEVNDFTGFKLNEFRNDVDLLNTVVKSLYNRILEKWPLHFVKNAIGADRLASNVISLLRINDEDVRMIGIIGSEGIGKTMVAGAVCEGTLSEFQRFCFLHKVGDAERPNCVALQKTLLQILGEANVQMTCHDINSNINLIKSKLQHKKVLLVLDGVTEKVQMEYFGAEDRSSFCGGSRILITTSDPNLLDDLKVDDRYSVEGLNRDEAFRLFCRHAFGSEEPKEGYEMLSRYLAHYVGGHPLALKKWGSFLNGKSKDPWCERCDKLVKSPDLNSEFWSSTQKNVSSGFGLNNHDSVGPDFGRSLKAYPFQVVGPLPCGVRPEICKDEGRTDVREIDVGFDSEAIKFVTVVYEKNGRRQKPVTLGTTYGETPTTRRIKITLSSEYLTSISGSTREVDGRTVIQSLTFHTNRGKLETVGTNNDGREFSFPYTGGKIIGFHGSFNASYLESIGAFYKQIPHTPIDYSGEVFGPFGGAGEKSWECDDIKGIIVRYADSIHSITFEDDGNTSTQPQTTYRGNCSWDTFKVKLENLNELEFITSFSGYFDNGSDGRIVINSLMFRTNKRILGPIGREKGKSFSSPSEAVKVIKFFGRTDDNLESIGAEVEPYYPFKSVGLFGITNESIWKDGNDHTDVRKILFEVEPRDERFIRSVTFCYEKNGTSCPPVRRGGTSIGKVIDPIKIDATEYLTSISGYYVDGGITSLSFRTNKRMIGPIGKEEGIHFSSPATGGKIVGFYGKSGENIEAIGAHFELIPDSKESQSIGPFGGPGGSSWDHDKFNGVREIVVMDDDGIRYLGFVYNDGGEQVGIDMRGSRTHFKDPKRVALDYSREYLTSISGYTKDQDGVIQSLTFYSNRRRLGPFGEEKGKYFWYPSAGTRITGFYGTRSETLNSIGVYTEPIPHPYPFKIDEPFKGSGGTPWDDGVHTDVRGFRFRLHKAIHSIGIAYDNNGSFVLGSEHRAGHNDNNDSFVLGWEPGEKGDDNYKEVLLDYPKERLSHIFIWVDESEIPGQTIIHDLQIVTTKKTRSYGPYNTKSLTKRDNLKQYRIPPEAGHGRIVGFFGRAETYLNSIGARLGPY